MKENENARHMPNNSLTVSVEPISFEAGQEAYICLAGLPDAVARVAWSVDRVDRDYTMFMMASEGALIRNDLMPRIHCPQFKDLRPGLYLVGTIELRNDKKQSLQTLRRENLGLVLFEIREPTSDARTPAELLKQHEEIVRSRQEEFLSGIGQGTRTFQVFVFFKDCLIRTRMRLGKYELVPFDGIPSRDQAEILRTFFTKAGEPELQQPDGLDKLAELSQPTAFIHFPVVRADDVEAATSFAVSEADLLIALLSLQRGGAGSIFASVVEEPSAQRVHYQLYTPTYRGNLVGGWLAGEEPRTVVTRMRTLHQTDVTVLYVMLFREALRELNPEFQYFRFWNILETIARHKGYIGQPKRDWQGNPLKNRHGQDQTIQDRAEELVLEILREKLAGSFGESSFGGQLQQGTLSEQIAIWYRHRNCVVHGGDCLCRNATLPLSNVPKYENCRRARQEPETPVQGYLFALRQVTELVLASELD